VWEEEGLREQGLLREQSRAGAEERKETVQIIMNRNGRERINKN
jgi:hypothetical protein